MCPGRSLDELPSDPYPTSGPTQATFEHIAHAKLAPDLFYIDGLSFVGKARIASDHEQGLETRQRGYDVFPSGV